MSVVNLFMTCQCHKPIVNTFIVSYTVVKHHKPLFTIFCDLNFILTFPFDLFCLEPVVDYHYIISELVYLYITNTNAK